MKHLLALSAGALLLFTACKKDNPSSGKNYHTGKNTYTINVDGISREYLVHVPQAYDGSSSTPMVLMVHGTGGQGQDMYDNSGWVDVGENENIITVFPSATRRCIFDEDEEKTTYKWNSQPADNWYYCPGVTPPDDIKYLRAVIEAVKETFEIDNRRVYLVGFSNGGQMAAKCSVYMGDVLAAIVESASSFAVDSTFTPVRKMPISYQVGNDDHGPGGTGPELPMSDFASAINNPVFKLYNIAQTHIKSFGLNPQFTISGDTSTAVIATYTPLDGNTVNNFNMVLIKNLKHAYPNGTNHWLEGARENWTWLKKYTLP